MNALKVGRERRFVHIVYVPNTAVTRLLYIFIKNKTTKSITRVTAIFLNKIVHLTFVQFLCKICCYNSSYFRLRGFLKIQLFFYPVIEGNMSI